MVVSYLPVGSEEADKFYAQCAIDAGCAFVNCLPVFIASDPEWAKKFTDAGLPIVGDDIKSQIGATITHRVMAKLFEDRGITIDRTYQLNVGGNMDFKNMLERDRLISKKISKTQAVTSNVEHHFEDRDIHVGPSDYVDWLDDRKWAFVRLEGRNFGGAPVSLEYKLEVWDSPNSAGVVIDAIRAAKIGLDRGVGGPLLSPVELLHEVTARAAPRRDRTGVHGAVHPWRDRALTSRSTFWGGSFGARPFSLLRGARTASEQWNPEWSTAVDAGNVSIRGIGQLLCAVQGGSSPAEPEYPRTSKG